MKAAISHIALYVKDLSASTSFYKDLLGLSPLEEPFKLGMHSWFSLGAFCQLHLIAGAMEIPAFHINHHLALRVANFDALLLKLDQNNIPYYNAFRVLHEVQVRPDGIRQVFLQDPDGYWIELNNESI